MSTASNDGYKGTVAGVRASGKNQSTQRRGAYGTYRPVLYEGSVYIHLAGKTFDSTQSSAARASATSTARQARRKIKACIPMPPLSVAEPAGAPRPGWHGSLFCARGRYTIPYLLVRKGTCDR